MAQFLDREHRQGYRSRLLTLGRLCAEPGFSLLEAFDDTEIAAVEIDVSPTKRQDLSSPHPGGERDHHRPVDPAVPDRVEQVLRLLGRQHRHLAALDLGQPLAEYVAWVASNKLLLHGTRQRAREDAVNVPPSPGREPALFAVATAARRPAVVRILNVNRGQLSQLQLAKCGH